MKRSSVAEVESLMCRSDEPFNLDYRGVRGMLESAADLSSHIWESTPDELVMAEFRASLTAAQRSGAVGDCGWARYITASADIVGER